jgi:hypothetical protein
MLGDPSRFLLAVFGIEAAFQSRARFFCLGAVVARNGGMRSATRCDSIPVAEPAALLRWQACVDTWG